MLPDRLDHKVAEVLKEILDQLDHKVVEVLKEILEQLDQPDLLDHKVV